MDAGHPDLNKDFTLAELVDTEFVRCQHCSNVFTNPLLLPCLHTFCEKCVEEILVRENVDKLKDSQHAGKIKTKHEPAARQNGDDGGHGKTGNSSTNNNGNPNGDPDTHNTRDQYTFNCPTCRSSITIESGAAGGGGLETNIATPDHEGNAHNNSIPDSKTTTTPETQDKKDENENSPLVQSLDISQAKYKALKRAIRHSLPINHFMESVTRLYRYRNEVGRECAYCKTEDVVEEATSLCLQCDDDVCGACAGAHRKTRITRNHSVVPYTAIRQGLFDHDIRKAYGVKCQTHPGVDVTHFCHDCVKVACKHCRTKHHHTHNIHQLTEAATNKLSADILHTQQGLSRRVPDLSQYIAFLTQQIASLEQRHRQATEEINLQAELIHRMVDEWRANILSDTDAAVKQEQEVIQDKIQNFKVSKSSMEKSASFLRHLYNLGKADEKMASYACVMRRYQQLIGSRPKAMSSRLGIAFTPGPTTGQNIRILIGQLGLRQEDLDVQDTAKSRLPISSLMPATLDTPLMTASWTIPSPSSSPPSTNNNTKPSHSCYISGIDIKGNLLACVDRKNAKVIVQDYSNQKVLKEFTGSGTHRLRKPFDIAFLPSGALAVTDPEASAVRVFDWTGKFLFTFDAEIQQDKSQLSKGRSDNKEKTDEGDEEERPLAVRHPRGITVTKTGEAVVLDGHFRHCTVHDSNTGKILRTIYPHKEITRKVKSHNRPSSGCKSNGPDQITDHDRESNEVRKSTKEQSEQLDVTLVDPFYICTTQDGHLVITDAASPNVKILEWPSGELLQESIDYGIRQEECLHPAGVCVDHTSGYILLVDTNNNRIHLGLPDGHFSTILVPPTAPLSTSAVRNGQGDAKDNTVTGTTTTNDLLSHPTCLCLDQDGHIVVGQVGGKINVYKYI